jgi:hypothetical protein
VGRLRRVSGTTRPPDFISLEAHRDREHPVERAARWMFVALLTAAAAAGLANVFGQRPGTATAAGPAATLSVRSPGALRGGLLFQARIEVDARAGLQKPTIWLDRGWFDNFTLNTVQPEPTKAASERGGVAFEFDPLPAGRRLTLYLQFQVNPTTVGRRSQDVVLRDGGRPIARVDRAVTIFP